MTKNAKRIFIIAGEASGDMYAAQLVSQILSADSMVKFIGVGSKAMRSAGVEIVYDAKDLAVIGVVDILFKLPTLFKVKDIIEDVFKNNCPDMLILVDYPGFNLKIAEIAKKYGIKVFYYIAPKLWASRPWRLKKVKSCIDRLAVIFPFEVDYFKKLGVEAHFVGNPLTIDVRASMSVDAAKQKFNLSTEKKIVGLFPGSRKTEIKRMLPAILRSAQILQQQFLNVQFILPLASSLSREDLLPYLKNNDLDIKIVEANVYDVIQVCETIIAVSGTVTLQIALMAVPMVIIYKTIPPFFPFKWVITTPYIGLCNIVAQKLVVKELWQQHASAKNIAAEIAKILTNDNYRQNIINEMQTIKAKLVADNAENLPKLVLDFLGENL